MVRKPSKRQGENASNPSPSALPGISFELCG